LSALPPASFATTATDRTSAREIAAPISCTAILISGPTDAVKTGLSLAGIAAKAFSTLFSMLSFGAMAGRKRTRQQARDEAQAAGNIETRHARDFAAEQQAREAAFDWQQHAQKTAQQEQDLSFAARYGTPPTREANLDREQNRRGLHS
jgi:hypothetical protein